MKYELDGHTYFTETKRNTVTRCGLKEDYRKQSTFSSFAHYCPKCGRNISPWVKEECVKL